jgi:hypothetical protein
VFFVFPTASQLFAAWETIIALFFFFMSRTCVGIFGSPVRFGDILSALLFFFPRLCFFMARCLYTYHSDERPRKAASKKSRFSLCYFCDWCYSLYSIVRASFFLLLFFFLLFSLLTLDPESTTMSMVDRHRADTLAFTRNTWGMRLSE